MSTDDNAATQARNRAAFVGSAMTLLGPDRELECEQLADIILAGINRIADAASVAFAPSAEISEAVGRNLAAQVERHADKIARVAVEALTEVYRKTLVAAVRGVPPPTRN